MRPRVLLRPLPIAVLVSCLLHGGLVLVTRLPGRAWPEMPVLPVEIVALDDSPRLLAAPPPPRPPARRRPVSPPRLRARPEPAAAAVQDREPARELPPPPPAPAPPAVPSWPEPVAAPAPDPAPVSPSPGPVAIGPLAGPVGSSIGPARADIASDAPGGGARTGVPAPGEQEAAGPAAGAGPRGGRGGSATLTPGGSGGDPGVTSWARPRGGYQVRPGYPGHVRRLGVQGTTVLRVHVLVDGRVGDVQVESSAGHTDLDQAAADAVRQWRFDPARRGSDAVAMWVLLPVEFRLK